MIKLVKGPKYYEETKIIKHGWEIELTDDSITFFKHGIILFRETKNTMNFKEDFIKELIYLTVKSLDIAKYMIKELGWVFNPLEFCTQEDSWKHLSRYYHFTIDELEKYKNRIYWYIYITRPNKIKISNKLMNYMMEESPIRKIKPSTFIKYIPDISKSFIKKYKKYISQHDIITCYSDGLTDNIDYFLKNQIIKLKNKQDYISLFNYVKLTKKDIQYMVENIKYFESDISDIDFKRFNYNSVWTQGQKNDYYYTDEKHDSFVSYNLKLLKEEGVI